MKNPILELSPEGLDEFLAIHREWTRTAWFQFRKRNKLLKEAKRLK